jgi:hypothetical protein
MSLSLVALQAALAQETGQVFLTCLTISHATLPTPIRLVNDKVDLVRAAGTFIAFPFEIALPEQRDDQLPQVELVIDNVDRSISQAIRNLTSPPTITLEVVLASSPNTLESGPHTLTLLDVSYDAQEVRGRLGFEDVLNEPFPKDSFTPKDFPGLFT